MKACAVAVTLWLTSTLAVAGTAKDQSTPPESAPNRWQLSLIPCTGGRLPELDGLSIAYELPWELTIMGLPLQPAISLEMIRRHRSKTDEHGSGWVYDETAYSLQAELHKKWGLNNRRITGSVYGAMALVSVFHCSRTDHEEDGGLKVTLPLIQVGAQAHVEIPRFPDLGAGLVWMRTHLYGSSVFLTVSEQGNLLELGLSTVAVIATAVAIRLLR
jgi:hypothetical protein